MKEDKELLDDLMYTKKDRSENMITGKFIKNAFNALKDEELLVNEDGKNSGNFDEDDDADGRFFVRRLRHLQHICQSIEGVIKDQERTVGKNLFSVAFLTSFRKDSIMHLNFLFLQIFRSRYCRNFIPHQLFVGTPG